MSADIHQKVKRSKACNACSLRDICLPALGVNKSAATYIKKDVIGGIGLKKLLNTLYVTSTNRYLSLDGENVVVFEEQDEIGRVPLHNLEGIVTFGYTGASPALMGACAQRDIGLTFMSGNGRFLARVSGEVREEMSHFANNNID